MVSRYVNNMREVNQPTTALGIRLTQLIIVARADNEWQEQPNRVYTLESIDNCFQPS